MIYKDDCDIVIGGNNIPSNRFRDDLDIAFDTQISDPIDKNILQLISLHKDKNLGIKFRSKDLKVLDLNTKQLLLTDILDALKIKQII